MRCVLRLIPLMVLAALGLGSCASDPTQGYTMASAHRVDFESIAVPAFSNDTYFHGFEFELTDALIKEIHRSTPWRVQASGASDTTLSGGITSARLRKLSTGADTGLVQEMAMELTVAFEWKENRTGRILVARRNFRVAEPFVPARGANERVEIGRRAAADQMAREIVAELRSSW